MPKDVQPLCMESSLGCYSIGVKFLPSGTNPLLMFNRGMSMTACHVKFFVEKEQSVFNKGEVYPVKPVRFLFNWGVFHWGFNYEVLQLLRACTKARRSC